MKIILNRHSIWECEYVILSWFYYRYHKRRRKYDTFSVPPGCAEKQNTISGDDIEL
jgi:hypothetical protein